MAPPSRGPKDDVTKYRCEDCHHPFDEFDAVHRKRKIEVLPRGDSIARALHDADPDDLATDGGYGNHYNVDGEQPSSGEEDDVVLERRTTIQRHDDGGLLIPDGGTSQDDEYVPGTCDTCGHTREYTRTDDGDVICILCEDGVGDAAQESDIVTDDGSVQPEEDETGARSVDDIVQNVFRVSFIRSKIGGCTSPPPQKKSNKKYTTSNATIPPIIPFSAIHHRLAAALKNIHPQQEKSRSIATEVDR